MFGVVQAVGVAAPFTEPSSHAIQFAPSKSSKSIRQKNRPSTLMPFRDDAKLVAFRYDETLPQEPPIPLPPPRSPLRLLPRTTSIPVPPPNRPAPPTEEHPALRTITSPQFPESDADSDWHFAPTVSSSSRSHTDYDADSSDEDEDPFAYENIDAALKAVATESPGEGSTTTTCSSIYSLYRGALDQDYSSPIPTQDQGLEQSNIDRVSDEAHRSSPSLSEGSTASPVPSSPVTPPAHFAKRFGRRSLSLRSGSSNTQASSMQKLRKKVLLAREEEQEMAGNAGVNDTGTVGANGTPSLAPPRWPPFADSRHAAANPIHLPSDTPNNSSISPSPVISTAIPCESFFEEDDLTKLSFSIRGSLIFGGRRPWKTTKMMADAKDVIPEQPSSPSAAIPERRVFPLVPTASKNPPGPKPARPPREDDMGVDAIIQKPIDHPRPSHHHHERVSSDPLNSATSTPAKLAPSIRVISAEAEKESQKVRSLYESGEGLQLGDGERPSSFGEPLATTLEVPSEVDENDSGNAQLRGHPTRVSAITSSLALQDDPSHPGLQLAGGIEDWEGIDGECVDRYGFIVPQRYESRPATPNSPSAISFSPRKHRNVLIKRDHPSNLLGVERGPTKKTSARSLNTHGSEVSAVSRRSVRSTIRQATNRLPHNRERRLVDEAGDVLASQPGLSHIHEDEMSEKVAADLKRKEAKRSDKWQKMAKVVKPGFEGPGTIFEFDVKHPKVIERTWKGIPDRWRSAAWYAFLASSAKADSTDYVTAEDLTAHFRRLVQEPSPDDTQIDLDVPRTINQHIMFRRRYRGGQRLLFRVLHALSLYFPETGYVQGMAPLAATLLSYYDEERCFVMLVRLWKFRGLNRIYQSGFVELMDALKDFETHWLNGKDVADKLRELSIDPTAYATRWYLTLFNLSIPFPVQLRVWDVFMLLGSSPPDGLESTTPSKHTGDSPSSKGLEILHATSLAIIDTLHTTLIDSDFENAMKSLTSWVPIKDEQKFLELVQIEWKKHHSRQKKI